MINTLQTKIIQNLLEQESSSVSDMIDHVLN